VPEDTPPKRVVVVTGGSQGIGAGVVDAYHREGWSVVATARTIEPADDPDLLTIPGDITDPDTVDRVVGGALERFGRIDTLVNNAGVYVSKPFTEYSTDDYASVVAVNLTGFFFLTQRVIAEMLALGSGHVVNITTTLVDFANSTIPSVLASLTKGGVAAATRALAIEHASRGIRVNAVSLGVIGTPVHPPETYAGVAQLHPLGRIGTIDDVVRGILFLESSPFVTGEIVHIDGGQIAGR
jgi:NAD(P)-dependent dehydrogenase (short-subunit alcohol dehydrogenase family)